MNRLTPILWYGSKTGMVPYLLSLMPPHKTCVEVFGGSGAFLFAKQAADVEIYNDLDQKLAEFFRLLTDPQKARLLRLRLELILYSRDVYDDYLQRFDSLTDEIERGVAFVIIANQSFNGKFGAGWKRSKACNCASIPSTLI